MTESPVVFPVDRIQRFHNTNMSYSPRFASTLDPAEEPARNGGVWERRGESTVLQAKTPRDFQARIHSDGSVSHEEVNTHTFHRRALEQDTRPTCIPDALQYSGSWRHS